MHMRRYTRLGSIAFALVLIHATGASAQWGRPRTPSVGACFYEDADFRGEYFCAPVGASVRQVPYGINDRISSIRVFGGAEVTIYRDADFRGSSKHFSFDVYNLARNGFNDRVSSYEISPRGGGYGGGWGGAYGGGSYGHGPYGGDDSYGGWAPTWGYERVPDVGVCFYERPNFGGQYFCARHGSSVKMVPRGSNDRISSVRLFGNTSVVVFNDRDFSGGSQTLEFDQRDLRRSGWNDTISSFRVVSRRRNGGQGGSWGGGAYGGGSYGGGSYGGGWNDHQDDRYTRGRRPSYEEARQIVRRAYLSVLGREPDSGSAGYVTRVTNDGWSQLQVENELRKSAEYRQGRGRR
jgi:hypothetical protein